MLHRSIQFKRVCIKRKQTIDTSDKSLTTIGNEYFIKKRVKPGQIDLMSPGDLSQGFHRFHRSFIYEERCYSLTWSIWLNRFTSLAKISKIILFKLVWSLSKAAEIKIYGTDSSQKVEGDNTSIWGFYAGIINHFNDSKIHLYACRSFALPTNNKSDEQMKHYQLVFDDRQNSTTRHTRVHLFVRVGASIWSLFW